MKVLIVDDDRIIREDIKHLINWESNGYELIADAANGMEALEIIHSTHVDIIFTDIYMPVMNGVELIKAVKRESQETQIIVMSNYDDFSYVKDAMKYGALDYFLKYQINDSSLLTILNSAASEVEKARKENKEKSYLMKVAYQEKRKNQKHFFKELINGCYVPEFAVKKAEELEIELPGWDFLTIYVQLEPQTEINAIDFNSVFQNVTHYNIILDEEMAFLVHFNEKSYLFMQNEIRDIVKKLSDCLRCTKNIIVYSYNCIHLKSLSSEISEMRNASKLYFYTGTDSMHLNQNSYPFRKELDDKKLEELENRIINAVKRAGCEEFNDAVHSLVLDFCNQKYHPDIVVSELKLLLQRIIKVIRGFHHYNTDVLTLLNNLLYELDSKFITLYEIEDKLKEILKRYFERSEQSVPDVTKTEISNAIKYIQKNYKKNITLAELAEYVNLSKNHLCMLFKQETGENFTDYVNKLRINEAKLLIAEKNYHVKEASYEVGINNERYFCKLFKKFTGCSPMEYKNRRSAI